MNRIVLMVLRNFWKVPSAYFKLRRYAKHVDKYPEEERYAHIQYIMGTAVRTGNIDLKVTGLENIPKEYNLYKMGARDGDKVVEINGNKYLDGGIADSIPLRKAQEMGYGKIIVVTTRPIEYRKEKGMFLPFKLKYKAYPKFLERIKNRYIEYNETVEEIIDNGLLSDTNKLLVDNQYIIESERYVGTQLFD